MKKEKKEHATTPFEFWVGQQQQEQQQHVRNDDRGARTGGGEKKVEEEIEIGTERTIMADMWVVDCLCRLSFLLYPGGEKIT